VCAVEDKVTISVEAIFKFMASRGIGAKQLQGWSFEKSLRMLYQLIQV
jgi:hypothetical protein